MSQDDECRLNIPAPVLVQLIDIIRVSEILPSDTLARAVIKLCRTLTREDRAGRSGFIISLLKNSESSDILCQYLFDQDRPQELLLSLEHVKALSRA